MTRDPHNFADPERATRRVQAGRRTSRRRRASLRAAVTEERGQVLPEFALVLPILLVVLLGVGWFGLALNTESDETHLANEVARYAIINENPGGSEALQQWAKKQGDTNFLAGSGKICITFPEGNEAGKPVKVVAESTLNWVPRFFPAKTLRGTAYMRLETTPSSYKEGCST
jgi:hypothetical protein